MVYMVSSIFLVKYIIYKCDGINGRRDEQLQNISDVILTLSFHLMPTCYSMFCMKQKSAKANLMYSENAKPNRDIFSNRKIQNKQQNIILTLNFTIF